MNSMEIKFFDHKVERFIGSLEEAAVAKVLHTIDLLEMFSNELSYPHSKKISAHLFELRVRGKQEVRIFYTFRKEAIVLLHGFIKKSQRIPKKEVEVALGKLRTLDLV